MVASYSDSPGEPIKIWDLRKGAAAKPKLMVIQSQVIDVVIGVVVGNRSVMRVVIGVVIGVVVVVVLGCRW